jgi:hypothetical protein
VELGRHSTQGKAMKMARKAAGLSAAIEQRDPHALLEILKEEVKIATREASEAVHARGLIVVDGISVGGRKRQTQARELSNRLI